MKKIILYAYDRINLGDDLFIHTITKRYPNVQFYLWSNKENIRTFQSIKNLKVLDQNSKFIKMLGRIRASFVARYKAFLEQRCDAVVYIGGSLFIEYENWNQILNWWEYEAENRKFYILGANFGPYQTESYKTRANKIFEKMQDVCFRDKYSQELFVNNSVVRRAPDILFTYDMPQVESIKKKLFISVIDAASKDEGYNRLTSFEQEYVNKILEIIKKYISQNYSIVLSSFCKKEGDEIAIRKILHSLDKEYAKQIDVLNYDGTNEEAILKSLAESTAIIASRFHAAILGFVAGRPVYPIVYSDKTIHVLEDMEFPGEIADIRNLSDINADNIKPEAISKYVITKLKKEAELHFEKLDKILNE